MVGCSGSFPSPDSPASCYLVEADDAQGRTWRVVLDLGSGALGPLQRYTRLDTVDGLDAVVLSHLHPDHFSDVCGLYVFRRYAPGRPGPGHASRLWAGRGGGPDRPGVRRGPGRPRHDLRHPRARRRARR